MCTGPTLIHTVSAKRQWLTLNVDDPTTVTRMLRLKMADDSYKTNVSMRLYVILDIYYQILKKGIVLRNANNIVAQS